MKRPVHICHVLPTFAIGGREVRTAAVINALGSAARHTIMPLDSRTDAAALLAPAVDFEVRSFPPPSGVFRAVSDVWRLLRDIRPDVVATYNWGTIEAVAAALLGRIPVVHTEDGFNADEATRQFVRRRVIRRALLRWVHQTLVPSRTLLRIARGGWALPTAAVTYVPNGVDTQRFSPRRTYCWRRALGIPDDDLVIGTVGRLSAEKNLPLLISAFNDLGMRRTWLVIVGDGASRNSLAEYAASLECRPRVLFEGNSPDPASYYAGFDVFVLSSSTEQMPLALLEAMASGLPAISTHVGDCAEMLGSISPPVIVPSGDEAALTDALRTLAADHALRRELGIKNRSRVVEEFSLERMCQTYAQALLGAAGSAKRMNG